MPHNEPYCPCRLAIFIALYGRKNAIKQQFTCRILPNGLQAHVYVDKEHKEKKMMKPDRYALYSIPMETLELSDEVKDLLRSCGIESIGDCIDASMRGRDSMISVTRELTNAIQDEVIPALRKQGYLSDD